MGEESADASALWEAAADAMSWTAAVREHAGWLESKKGWAAKAESDDAVRRAAEECGRIVDGRGAMDAASIEGAGGAIRLAAGPLVRASKAFARSSRLGEAAGAELRRASRAYGRAGDHEYAATVAERAAGSRDHARTVAMMASTMLGRARWLARDATRLADGAAGRPSPGPVLHAVRAALSSLQVGMREDARQARAESVAMAGKMEDGVQATAKMRRVTARAAELSAERAAAAAARGRGRPDVEEAAAAWRRAVAKAHGVEDRSRRRDANRTAQAGPPVL